MRVFKSATELAFPDLARKVRVDYPLCVVSNKTEGTIISSFPIYSILRVVVTIINSAAFYLGWFDAVNSQVGIGVSVSL